MSTDDLTGATTAAVVARTPADLLGVIPYLLGFRPADSLVMVVLQGTGVVFTARVDLPADLRVGRRRSDQARRMGDELSRVVLQHGADGVVLVGYTEHRTAGVGFLTGVARRFAVPVEAVVCAGSDTWVAVADGLAGPVEPYDPVASDGAVQAVLAGLVALPDRDAVVAGVQATDGPERDAVAAALAALGPPGGAPVTAVRLSRLLHDHGPPSPRAMAVLARSVATPDGFEQALGSLRRPAERHLLRWSAVARLVPAELSGPPCTLAGVAAWLTGDGAAARSWLERVTAEHPDAFGIGLLDHVLESAIAPTQWDPDR